MDERREEMRGRRSKDRPTIDTSNTHKPPRRRRRREYDVGGAVEQRAKEEERDKP